MTRYIAFLRAINVGGRNVKMETLRALCAGLGFSQVETFTASGNLIFGSESDDEAALQRQVESCLRAALGYEVHTFLRTDAEVALAAQRQPFTAAELQGAAALNVGFLLAPLSAPQTKQFLARFKTDIDDFRVHGREIYWLCRERQSDSKFSNAAMERAIKARATWRNATTVAKIAAKYPPSRAPAR